MLLLCLFVIFVSVQCTPQIYLKLDTGLKNPHSRFRRSSDNFFYIPYQISDEFSKNSFETILESFAHFENQTCLKFYETTYDYENDEYELADSPVEAFIFTKYCYIAASGDGESAVISLNEEFCLNETAVFTRFLYLALGFKHENLRPDRDDYVTVLWENIGSDAKSAFHKGRKEDFDTELPYDLLSISHYYPDEYSRNGKPTLISKDPNKPLKWNTELSAWDLYKINSFYCTEEEDDETTTVITTSTHRSKYPKAFARLGASSKTTSAPDNNPEKTTNPGDTTVKTTLKGWPLI